MCTHFKDDVYQLSILMLYVELLYMFAILADCATLTQH